MEGEEEEEARGLSMTKRDQARGGGGDSKYDRVSF